MLLLTVPAAVRAARRPRRGAGGDAPARLLGVAVAALPESHGDWGRAMCAELATVPGPGPRWRFSLGCARAAGLICARVTLTARGGGGAGLRGVIGAGLITTMALVGYGVVRYPGLRSSADAAIGAITLVASLLTYGAVTLALSRGTQSWAPVTRRNGLLGGAVIGAAWLIVLSPTGFLKEWVLLPLAVALLAPTCVGALSARAGRGIVAGSRAALWSGIVGGLTVFVVWTTATYVRDGRPYDAQLLRDFHRGGAPDLATLAVSDNLSSALALMVIIPLTALAFGSLGARLAFAEPAPVAR